MLPNSLIATLNFRKYHGAKNLHQTTSDLYISAKMFRFEYIHSNFIHGEDAKRNSTGLWILFIPVHPIGQRTLLCLPLTPDLVYDHSPAANLKVIFHFI